MSELFITGTMEAPDKKGHIRIAADQKSAIFWRQLRVAPFRGGILTCTIPSYKREMWINEAQRLRSAQVSAKIILVKCGSKFRANLIDLDETLQQEKSIPRI